MAVSVRAKIANTSNNRLENHKFDPAICQQKNKDETKKHGSFLNTPFEFGAYHPHNTLNFFYLIAIILLECNGADVYKVLHTNLVEKALSS